MWPVLTPLWQQLKTEVSTQDWLLTGYALAGIAPSVEAEGIRLQSVNSTDLLQQPFQQRYGVALLQLRDEDNQQQLSLTLGRLRDLLAERVVAVIPPNSHVWTVTHLLEFGFSRILDQDGWQVWGFDIHTYKQVPDWLNARFWANPENWNRFRW